MVSYCWGVGQAPSLSPGMALHLGARVEDTGRGMSKSVRRSLGTCVRIVCFKFISSPDSVFLLFLFLFCLFANEVDFQTRLMWMECAGYGIW